MRASGERCSSRRDSPSVAKPELSVSVDAQVHLTALVKSKDTIVISL